MDMICQKCGYRNYFEVEEETGKLYCLYCGEYVDIEIMVVE